MEGNRKAVGSNRLWYMKGTAPDGGSPRPKMKDRRWEVAGPADLNGDGQADVLWRHAPSGDNCIWLMDGTKMVSRKRLQRVGTTAWQPEYPFVTVLPHGRNTIPNGMNGAAKNTLWYVNLSF
jgi:hypothetical protein